MPTSSIVATSIRLWTRVALLLAVFAMFVFSVNAGSKVGYSPLSLAIPLMLNSLNISGFLAF